MRRYRRTKPGDPLSARQSDVFEAIVSHVRRHGSAPTVREIAEALGVSSTVGVMAHLDALRAKGAIRTAPGKARGIRIVGPACPCCGGLGVKLDAEKALQL